MYCSPASTASPFYGSSNPAVASFQDLQQSNTSVGNAFSASQTQQQQPQFQTLSGLDTSGVVSPGVVIGDTSGGGSDTYPFASYPGTSNSSHPVEVTSSGSETATFFQTKRFKVPDESANTDSFPGLKSTNEHEIESRTGVLNCGDVVTSLPSYGLPPVLSSLASSSAVLDQSLNSHLSGTDYRRISPKNTTLKSPGSSPGPPVPHLLQVEGEPRTARYPNTVVPGGRVNAASPSALDTLHHNPESGSINAHGIADVHHLPLVSSCFGLPGGQSSAAVFAANILPSHYQHEIKPPPAEPLVHAGSIDHFSSHPSATHQLYPSVYSQLLASAATGQSPGVAAAAASTGSVPPVNVSGGSSAAVGGVPSTMIPTQYPHSAAAAAALYSPYAHTGAGSAQFAGVTDSLYLSAYHHYYSAAYNDAATAYALNAPSPLGFVSTGAPSSIMASVGRTREPCYLKNHKYSLKKSKKCPSPVPDHNYDRIFIWDLEETLIIYHSLLSGTYAQRFGKDSQQGMQLGLSMENLVYSMADMHFFYTDLEDCDQIHINDVLPDDNGIDLSSYNFAADGFVSGSSAVSVGVNGVVGAGSGSHLSLSNPGSTSSAVRGGVDYLRKLSYRYRKIKDNYNNYSSSNVSKLLGSKQEQWMQLRSDIEQYCDNWHSYAFKALSHIANKCNQVNVLVTNTQLVPACVKILLYGMSGVLDIENIYSSPKLGKEECFERIIQRFGRKCSYVCVGGGKDEEQVAKVLDMPYWRINTHSDYIAFLQAQDLDYL